ncbi:uracil-DNA glycosylase-like isoform X2 [Paramacrobiotus metropolitanus]|nr:uracil-DNA glycosylase-like isoform X2 [Paramacrobiotus metropolitanus]
MPAHQKTLLSFFQSVPKPEGTPNLAGPAVVVVPQQAPKRSVGSDLDNPAVSKKLKSDCDVESSANATDAKVTPVISEDPQKRAHQNFLKAKLIQHCRRLPLLTPKFGLTWFEALEKEFSKDYFLKLSEFVTKERQNGTVFPPADQVFSWTEHFPIQDTKVVILGQDPYHGVRQAHGLCFSVQKGVPPPPSLVNIYKELSTDIPAFCAPSHGNLTGWAQQGVLLLNAVLTVRSGNANSHKDKGWEVFTDAVIEWLNLNLSGVVFVLWGRYAQAKCGKLDKKRHCVLMAAHPSPLSVTKFLGCKHFSAANDFLNKKGKKPINWAHLQEE